MSEQTTQLIAPLVGPSIDPVHFRSVLGAVPTGVAVITACGPDLRPVGMTVGTFTSISLDPPLVGFLAVRSSGSWQAIKEIGSFCANILSDEQEAACRAFASRAEDKFAGIPWKAANSGSPVLEDVVAWVDCDIESVLEAGDHDIVVGRVRELQQGGHAMPLVFLKGGYGKVGLRSGAEWHGDLLQPFRLAELARPHLESLADKMRRECILTAAVQEELVLVAGAGTPQVLGLTRVGQRIPFIPPLGSLFVAWAADDLQATWRRRIPDDLAPEADEQLTALLSRVRERGFTAGVGRAVHHGAETLLAQSFSEQRSAVRASIKGVWDVLCEGIDPLALDQQPGSEVRSLAVPVYNSVGQVVLSLGVHALPTDLSTGQLEKIVDELTSTARSITDSIDPVGA